ncbi:gliding motility-associated C-terminal domain-containing protein, partial [Aquimarina sp. M1]
FTATYILTAEDVLSGEVRNQAIVTGQDLNGNDVTDVSDDPINTTDIDLDNDGDSEDETVTIVPSGEDVIIYSGISPNGDGINDEFIIRGIEDLENTLEIYNRWGVKVFSANNYGSNDNLFRGISNGRSTISANNELPVGTYYYVIQYVIDSGERKNKAGYLYINK